MGDISSMIKNWWSGSPPSPRWRVSRGTCAAA